MTIYGERLIMIDYFYPELGGKNTPNKKVVNELMNPDKAYADAVRQANLKRPTNEIQQKNPGKLLTNDGREMLNENL